jgi:hypothetical protein
VRVAAHDWKSVDVSAADVKRGLPLTLGVIPRKQVPILIHSGPIETGWRSPHLLLHGIARGSVLDRGRHYLTYSDDLPAASIGEF